MAADMAKNPQWAFLRWVREFRGLTQAQVASAVRAAGGRLSDDHLSRVERGENTSLAYHTVQAWLDTLDVPMAVLDEIRRSGIDADAARAVAADFVFNSLSQLTDRELRRLLRERYGSR